VYYPHKDPVTLAEATRRLNEKGCRTETRITMESGDFHAWDNAGAELGALNSAAYGDCLHMGRIDHETLSNALRDYDAFVFPSMAETFGFPMVEAMQAGVPLVVSDIPIHREICGEAALYFRMGDADDLVARIEELDQDEDLRRTLIQRGRERVRDKFTWELHVAGLLSVFRGIVARDRHRLLINALHARTGGGVTYLRNMLPRMAADKRLDIHVCLHEDQEGLLPTDLKNVSYHFQRYRRGFWRILAREQIELPRLAKRLDADSLFSPANYGPFRARNHVVMARNAVSVGFVERRPLKLAYWALLYAATFVSFRGCRKAIAVSEYAKRGIERAFFGAYSDRLVVIPHGVERQFLDSKEPETRDEFLLAVSDIYVQKNFTSLVRALAIVSRDNPNLVLKVAGGAVDDDYFLRLKSLIRDLGLDSKIEFLGHVDANELGNLYLRCKLFVFPSTVETFGNPLVEAMACGAAIASSNTAAMPEVLGEAARYFDPYNIESIATTLSELLANDDIRADLSARARKRAKAFSWDNTARRTIDTILGENA